MPDLMHLLKIGAPRERVYEALTTAEGIRNWWTRDADLDEAVGGKGEFRFPRYGGERYKTEVTIEELVPAEKVCWKVVSSFRPPWIGTKITFDLRYEKEGSTTLAFAHCGFPNADDEYAMCTTGWGYYLVSLQQYLQTGKGAPSPDVDFARVIGRQAAN